jgi:hypothetical protein
MVVRSQSEERADVADHVARVTAPRRPLTMPPRPPSEELDELEPVVVVGVVVVPAPVWVAVDPGWAAGAADPPPPHPHPHPHPGAEAAIGG